MADTHDKDSKTEDATEKKIRDSLEKGQVPHSREAATLASTLAILIGAVFLFGNNLVVLKASLQSFIDNPGEFPLNNSADVTNLLGAATFEGAKVIMPMLILMAIAGLAASFLQNQPQLVLERIRPQMSRISHRQGLVEGLWRSGPSRVSEVAVQADHRRLSPATWRCAPPPRLHQPAVHGADRRSGHDAGADRPLSLGRDRRDRRAGWCGSRLVTLLLASRPAHDEAGGEGRAQADGRRPDGQDPPEVAAARPLAQAHDGRGPKGDADRCQSDTLLDRSALCSRRRRRADRVAKGKDLIALKIRFIAEENGIPIYEDRALARSLYASVDVDRMIPSEFYKAVAGIILFLAARGQTG